MQFPLPLIATHQRCNLHHRLVVVRAYQALGVLFLSVVTVPVTDFLITMSAPGNSVAMAALKHLSSVPLILSLGIYFLRVSRTG